VEGKISTTSGKEISVSVGIRVLTKEERKKNAIKILGICWGLSLATIPLPPIHWVTVPGFFIAGIVMFFRKLREPEYFDHVKFTCPECGKEVEVPPQVVKSPLSFVCPHCRYGLKLTFDH
jgi:hypothetical protein